MNNNNNNNNFFFGCVVIWMKGVWSSGKLLCSPGLQDQQANLVVPANEKKTNH